MRLDEINALRELDRGEVIAKARELDIHVDAEALTRTFPTTDSLRLAIIEKTIEAEEADRPDRPHPLEDPLEAARSVLEGIGGFDDARPNERDTRALVAAATALLAVAGGLQDAVAAIENVTHAIGVASGT
jgi:hypothetical protein